MLDLHGKPPHTYMLTMRHAACQSASRACRWIIQDALKVAAHALLMAFNVFGVRTWDAGKGGVDGRLLGIRVRVDFLRSAAHSRLRCSKQPSSSDLIIRVSAYFTGVPPQHMRILLRGRSADHEVHVGGCRCGQRAWGSSDAVHHCTWHAP